MDFSVKHKLQTVELLGFQLKKTVDSEKIVNVFYDLTWVFLLVSSKNFRK